MNLKSKIVADYALLSTKSKTICTILLKLTDGEMPAQVTFEDFFIKL